jgi:hypothetical protein
VDGVEVVFEFGVTAVAALAIGVAAFAVTVFSGEAVFTGALEGVGSMTFDGGDVFVAVVDLGKALSFVGVTFVAAVGC